MSRVDTNSDIRGSFDHSHHHLTLSFPHYSDIKRLCWSRGSVLAFGTQVRGFKPWQKPSDFSGRKKILRTPSFGREVKPFVPCRIFAVCKRVCVEVAAFGRNYRPFLAQVVSPFTTRVSGGDTWLCK